MVRLLLLREAATKHQPVDGKFKREDQYDTDLGDLRTVDTELEDEQIAGHLRDPFADVEIDYGPVPPTAEEPYTTSDPLARDTSPLPTSPIKRG